MGVLLEAAYDNLESAVQSIFSSDPRVHSVGITQEADGTYAFRAVRNVRKLIAQNAGALPPAQINSVPIEYADAYSDLKHLVRLPRSGAGSPQAASTMPEQQQWRPLVCGLQVENFDDDTRTGEIAAGDMVVGSLGCFVRMGDGTVCILSNNHVIAGENRGINGSDRILQPGDPVLAPADQVAVLTDFAPINFSPVGTSPGAGAVMNDIDAGIAALISSVSGTNGYLPARSLKAPAGNSVAAIGARVFKVGRTAGLTNGTVTSVATTVGPIAYGPGNEAWFHNSLEVAGEHGTTFSDHGDSGSAIVDATTNEVVALLYAGNGLQTYACPIDAVLSYFAVTVA